ncbi:YnfA family protein [Asaia bogorensis]|uniref:YnfA family protein n=1 Tax=Asaia bogorensis TaxID=91915 RepID=UPI000EFAE0C2|nr:YnfA family protein [Asaia bogorensis]
MLTLLYYLAAGFAEIGGCFAFWGWARLGKPIWWLLPGMLSLAFFALILTRIDSDSAGRAYAAYGGVYITASLVWMRVFEGRTPDRWELAGAVICLGGAALILWGPRST